MVYDKVTISGQICTGKTTLYQALGKRLDWPTFSTGQFFRDYAAKHQFDLEAAEEQSAKITKKIDYQVRDLLKTKKYIIVEGWLAGLMAANTPGVFWIVGVGKSVGVGGAISVGVGQLTKLDKSWLLCEVNSQLSEPSGQR